MVKRLILVVGVLLVGLLSACTAEGPTTQEGYVGGTGGLTIVAPDDRKPAPMISGEDLASDDGTIDLADHAGMVIVINVWGSWCAPCRAEAPDLVAAAEQTEGTAQFIGLNTRDLNRAAAQKFVEEAGITYPSIFDPQGRLLLEFTDLPPSGIPSTLVIDQEGRVAARIIGVVNTTTLVGLVEDVAAGK